MMRGLGLAAALAFASWLSVASALAATFLLEGGETVEGAIIAATRSTVTLRPAQGGMRQIPVGRLEWLEITTADGQRLRGRYHGWVDGRAGLEVGSEVLWLERDRVVARAPLATRALARGGPPASAGPATAATGTEPARASPAAEPASAATGPASEAAATEPASAPAPARPAERGVASVIAPVPPGAPEPSAGPETAALPSRDLPALSITTAPDEVTRKSGEIVFTLELSRPIDELLVVIYSTIDGTARAGVDYQAAQGILTLPAGATRAQVRTSVLADDEAGGDKDFQLFVATNPDLTEVAQQWVEVTIRDED